MKTALLIVVLLLAGVVTYLLLKPTPKPKEIIIPKTEYRDSPKIDSLQAIVDTLKNKESSKKQVFYKYLTTFKDTGSLKIVHDSIYILATDVFQAQDSIITLKDSIIANLTDELKLCHDSVYYYRVAYTDATTKVKRWKRISLGSLLLNGLLILKL